MPSFKTLRPVPFGPDAMLELVADVERYPEFVPLCESLKVISRSWADDGTEIIVARMSVGYGPIRETFTSRIAIDRRASEITVTHLDGPFRVLDNRWRFIAKPAGCDVSFQIAYEFRSLALQLLLGSLFDRVFRKFAEAFETRARKIYGADSANWNREARGTLRSVT
jgi:coenzyme Q-binding protein COQ10